MCGISIYKESKMCIRDSTLLRPRFGDFCYTDYEHEMLKKEVKMFRELGADGVVIGALRTDGSLHTEQMCIRDRICTGTAFRNPGSVYGSFDSITDGKDYRCGNCQRRFRIHCKNAVSYTHLIQRV